MRFYTIIFPNAFSTLVTALVFILGSQIEITGQSGMLEAIILPLSILPGFYIASLAAVSTFGDPHMDIPLPDPAPKVYIQTAQTRGQESLSRRMFLSYLFGYLAVSSLLLVGFCSALNLIGPSLKIELQNTLPKEYIHLILWFKFAAIYAIFNMVGSILVSTLQGVYYLMEGIFQPL